MKVCILGAGSLGCVIGGALELDGHEVHLVGRAQQMDTINKNGLTMIEPNGQRIAHPYGHVDSSDIGRADLVIVLCKSFDTTKTVQDNLGVIGNKTIVMSLQNGLGSEDMLCDLVGAHRVIGAKTYVSGMLLEPGRVQATIPLKDTFIGELDGSVTERVKRIGNVFESAGMHCIVSDNIMGIIWDKLLVNVATGAACGITHLPYGDLYQEEKIMNMCKAAVQEGMDVAHAAGIKLSFNEPQEALDTANKGLPYTFKPSVLQSLEKHRPTEIGVINGAVVAQGKKYGIATPVNETLVACIRGIERYIREYLIKEEKK